MSWMNYNMGFLLKLFNSMLREYTVIFSNRHLSEIIYNDTVITTSTFVIVAFSLWRQDKVGCK